MRLAAFLAAATVAACTDAPRPWTPDAAPPSSSIPSAPRVPATPTADPPPPPTPDGGASVTLPPDSAATLAAITTALAPASGLSPATFAARHALPFVSALGYDPSAAANLPLLQSSSLALTPAELAALAAHGFVISEGKRYPTFSYGYATIYSQDLPVFVSADSILYAVHRSYDAILKSIEQASLVAEVGTLLTDMRARLAAGAGGGFGDGARADADLFLAVAASLLTTPTTSTTGATTPPALTIQPPVAGADLAAVTDLVTKAVAAKGTKSLNLFGVSRIIDFSQFTPRGHYLGDATLERYFRTMIWLGRIDFPILDYGLPATPDGRPIEQVHRPVLEAAFALGELMDDATLARWSRIDAVLRAFVGEPDSMSPPELAHLRADLAALGATDHPSLAALSDDAIAQAIVSGGYGQQRIASQIVVGPPHTGTLPLAATFLLMGQRYVVDSHVFSNVVYDRVNVPGVPWRMMPNPLDVGFAALGNDQAGALLAPELERYQYAPDLERMRLLVEAHGDDFWSANLYNRWLSALRALSPVAAELGDRAAAGLPSVAATEAWGRRLLSAQLASWAELRHDTILYVKQSYTFGVTCEFPDAYVEPNPAFFSRIAELATAGSALAPTIDPAGTGLGTSIGSYFTHLGDVAAILQRMAEHQRTGMPHDAADVAFINGAVTLQNGCGGPSAARGWYPQLIYAGAKQDVTFDPTIADVHTEPTDEGGAPVGRVLHVGTGHPRLMVVTVDTCAGPRAYAGLASSYFETTTGNFDRLDDIRWSASLTSATPADVPWMSDLVVR